MPQCLPACLSLAPGHGAWHTASDSSSAHAPWCALVLLAAVRAATVAASSGRFQAAAGRFQAAAGRRFHLLPQLLHMQQCSGAGAHPQCWWWCWWWWFPRTPASQRHVLVMLARAGGEQPNCRFLFRSGCRSGSCPSYWACQAPAHVACLLNSFWVCPKRHNCKTFDSKRLICISGVQLLMHAICCPTFRGIRR